MGLVTYKIAPNRDLYVVWSTETENAVLYGTGEEAVEFLVEEAAERAREDARQGLTRANETGSSGRMTGRWTDEFIRVGANCRVRREHLFDYAAAYLDEDHVAAEALLEPYGEDD